MGVPISNVPRRVVYAASGTGPYAFTFEILANTDIAVYKDDALLTLTTDYTVTIASNGTGSITLTASPTGATQIAIVGNRTIKRTTDFVTGGDFFANTINDELDQQTIFAQQNAEAVDRALKAPQTDPTTINMTLPRAALRAGKTLAFDDDGNPTLGDTLGTNRGNWQSGVLYFVRDIVKDTSTSNIFQCIEQHTSSGSQPLTTNTDSAKWFKLVDAEAAGDSADDAAASATLASEWATKTSGAVSGGEYSAKYHAQAAATSASNASTSASNASTSAGTASTQATNAANSATAAATSATNAASSATDAANSAAAAATALDAFDDRYLGAKSSDPSVDNDGNALVTGALYYRTTAPIGMKVYDGTTWVAASAASVQILTTYQFTATAGQTTFTGTDNNGLTLAYTAGCVLVTRNGVILEISSEVTASNGTSVVLASGASVGDEVNVIAFTQFNVAGVYTQEQTDAKFVNLNLPRVSSSDEGGQINFNRASDNTATWAIDSYGSTSTPSLRFVDGANVRAVIDGSGNVGIGTSSPSTKLDIRDGDIELSDSSYTRVPAIKFTGYSGSRYTYAQISADEFGSYNGGLIFSTKPSGAGSSLTERARIDDSGVFYFDSGYGSSAKAYGCRAWVNFNGTGTVAIRGSGNVSSITDNGTGNYTVNFTTAMPDANYSAVALSNEAASGSGTGVTARATGTATSSAFSVETVNFSAGRFDSATVYVSIFR